MPESNITPAALTAIVELLKPLLVPPGFNPNSIDSQFANLHTSIALQDKSRNQRMDHQEQMLSDIVKQTSETNGRVTKLESKWKAATAWIAGASATALLIIQIILHFWK